MNRVLEDDAQSRTPCSSSNRPRNRSQAGAGNVLVFTEWNLEITKPNNLVHHQNVPGLPGRSDGVQDGVSSLDTAARTPTKDDDSATKTKNE
jgi:hypothetical protein